MKTPEEKEPWYSDHRIPLGLILAFLLQGGSVIWFTSGLNSKVVELDRRTTTEESILAGPNGLSERLTRLEEKSSSAQKSLDRIEQALTTAPMEKRR